MIKVSTIKLREDNPRMITEAALDKLGESIERDPEYMVIRPIVIDEDRVVLGGNQRLKAIIKLGKKTIPDKWVVQVKDWEEAKRKRFILVDNGPEGMSGGWDIDKLEDGWDKEELKEVGLAIPYFGKRTPQAEEEELRYDGKPTYEILPEYDEKYEAIIIVCENEIDYMNIIGRLGMEKMEAKKEKKVGRSNIISAKQFMEKMGEWSAK